MFSGVLMDLQILLPLNYGPVSKLCSNQKYFCLDLSQSVCEMPSVSQSQTRRFFKKLLSKALLLPRPRHTDFWQAYRSRHLGGSNSIPYPVRDPTVIFWNMGFHYPTLYMRNTFLSQRKYYKYLRVTRYSPLTIFCVWSHLFVPDLPGFEFTHWPKSFFPAFAV